MLKGRVSDYKGAADSIVELLENGPLAWMVRIGYLARGMVFVIIGSFALLAAGGFGVDPRGIRDLLEAIFQRPFGGPLLWALAAGLLCFAGWRFLQAVFDLERYGNALYGLMRRGVLVGSGAFYLLLAVTTARITFAQRRMSEEQSAREWAEWVMTQPLGRVMIALIAAGFVAIAIGLVVKAIRAPYRHRLDAPKTTRIWADVLGSFGTLTRAVAFLTLGGFLGVAAYDSNSQEAVTMTGVLRAMQNQAHGGVLLGIAALGFLAFGFFEIIEAPQHRVDTLRSARRQSRTH